MKLLDLVNRQMPPAPWGEGDNIPWDDPDFSRRMLKEHLSQDHDAASRRSEIIDRQVEWIHSQVLSGRPTKVLDLGCGPGLYASRLARLGHECVGIDYSPASIAFAREQATRERLQCSYVHEDMRRAEYGAGFGLAMLIHGEFNTFRPRDARLILRKCHEALARDGALLLEPHTFEAMERRGREGASWYSAPSGLFSDGPHVVLEESFWDAEARAATTRHVVVDVASAEVQMHSSTCQAYTEDDYQGALEECGFRAIEFFPSLTGRPEDWGEGLLGVVARK